ncbi:hypothetical protein DFJ73DRAFT_958038 [Zopfochytrium polystomum]|nr:hypothetical protein DFJ73DRAFT_958038 [Zopfochytrium polystomum]
MPTHEYEGGTHAFSQAHLDSRLSTLAHYFTGGHNGDIPPRNGGGGGYNTYGGAATTTVGMGAPAYIYPLQPDTFGGPSSAARRYYPSVDVAAASRRHAAAAEAAARPPSAPPIVVAATSTAPLRVNIDAPADFWGAGQRVAGAGRHITTGAGAGDAAAAAATRMAPPAPVGARPVLLLHAEDQPTLDIQLGARRGAYPAATITRGRRSSRRADGDVDDDGYDLRDSGDTARPSALPSRPALLGRGGLVRGGRMDPVEALIHPISMTRPSANLARRVALARRTAGGGRKVSPAAFLVQLANAVDALREGKMPTNDQLNFVLARLEQALTRVLRETISDKNQGEELQQLIYHARLSSTSRSRLDERRKQQLPAPAAAAQDVLPQLASVAAAVVRSKGFRDLLESVNDLVQDIVRDVTRETKHTLKQTEGRRPPGPGPTDGSLATVTAAPPQPQPQPHPHRRPRRFLARRGPARRQLRGAGDDYNDGHAGRAGEDDCWPHDPASDGGGWGDVAPAATATTSTVIAPTTVTAAAAAEPGDLVAAYGVDTAAAEGGDDEDGLGGGGGGAEAGAAGPAGELVGPVVGASAPGLGSGSAVRARERRTAFGGLSSLSSSSSSSPSASAVAAGAADGGGGERRSRALPTTGSGVGRSGTGRGAAPISEILAVAAESRTLEPSELALKLSQTEVAETAGRTAWRSLKARLADAETRRGFEDRFIAIVRDVHRQEDRDARKALLTLLDFVADWSEDVAGRPAKRGGRLADTNMKMSIMAAKILAERFMSNTALDPLFEKLTHLRTTISGNPRLRSLASDIEHFLRRCITDSRYAVRHPEDLRQDLREVIDRFANELATSVEDGGELLTTDKVGRPRDWRRAVAAVATDEEARGTFASRLRNRVPTEALVVQEELGDIWKELQRLLDGIRRDKSIPNLMKALGEAWKAMFLDDSGTPTVKTTLWTDLMNVYLPVICEQIELLPVPRVEYIDKDWHFVFEYIVLLLDNILPNLMEVKVANSIIVGLREEIGSAMLHTFTFNFYQIQLDVRDIPYYIAKKSGFPKFADSGYASLLIGGRGITLSVNVDIDFASDERTIIPNNVAVDIDNLDINIAGSKSESVLKVIKTNITTILRRELSNLIGQQVLSTLETIDRRLTDVKPAMRALSQYASDAAKWVPNTAGHLRRQATSYMTAILPRAAAEAGKTAGGAGGGFGRQKIGKAVRGAAGALADTARGAKSAVDEDRPAMEGAGAAAGRLMEGTLGGGDEAGDDQDDYDGEEGEGNEGYSFDEEAEDEHEEWMGKGYDEKPGEVRRRGGYFRAPTAAKKGAAGAKWAVPRRKRSAELRTAAQTQVRALAKEVAVEEEEAVRRGGYGRRETTGRWAGFVPTL